MVGWDNTARRPYGATIFEGATPEVYERWLRGTVRLVADVPEEENYVFLLAWNEWAEGNHLEPDHQYGRAWLEATRDVLVDDGPPASRGDPSGNSRPRPATTGKSVRLRLRLPARERGGQRRRPGPRPRPRPVEHGRRPRCRLGHRQPRPQDSASATTGWRSIRWPSSSCTSGASPPPRCDLSDLDAVLDALDDVEDPSGR